MLVVDDDPDMAETLADVLAASDFAVTTSGSGAAAIAAARRSHFDAVLMDIQMPGINGIDAFRAMKTDSPAVRVILMTAYTRDDLVEEGRRLSPMAILPKPLDLERVLTLLRA